MSYTPAQLRAVIELMSDDPLYFGHVVAPQYFTNEFAVFHRHMLKKINNLPAEKKTIVVEVPRGNGKTIIVSTLNGLHRAMFAGTKNKRLKYIIIASYSNTKAKQIINDYRNIILGENFQGVFPGTVLLKDREDMIEVENKDLNIKFMVMARGRESQVAGLRYEETRPELFIADDLENPDEAYNQGIVDANVRFIDETVQYGLAPNGYSILIGTPFAFDCFTERFAKREVGVTVIKYPQLVETPEMATELGIEIGHSIWENRFPTETIIAERDAAIANGTFDIFMRQRQLNPISDAQVRFDMSQIGRISNNERNAYFKDKKLNIYILSDYAYSRHLYADESAILVFGVDDEANYYMLHSDKGKWGDRGTTDKIIEQVRIYQKDLKLVGVEARGFGFIERDMLAVKRELNIAFSVIPLEPKNRPKPLRIKSMISVVGDGRVFFVGEHKKLESELAAFRGEELSHGDDLSDTFGYILDVASKPTTQKTLEEKKKEEAHRDWLKFSKEMDEYKAKPQYVRSVHEDRYY